MTETGCYDRNGIPIYVGDLIRVKHYRHVRCRRQMWLYFRVAHNGVRPVVQHWSDLNPANWQCNLVDCGLLESEVIDEAVAGKNEQGELITFNERPRRK